MEQAGGVILAAHEDSDGLQVIDVSNPANCVRGGGYVTSEARGVAVVAGRIYVADESAGLLVLPTLPNVHLDAGTLGTPYTLEAATSLTPPIQWSPLWTTNPPALPFDYVDFDVKIAEKPRKFYRVRQP